MVRAKSPIFTYEKYFMKRTVCFLLFIGIVTLIPSCFKEESLENGNINTAKGSLQRDGNDDCLPKTITGVYEAGTTLTSANFITIDVNVSTAGNYSIVSDVVNGYSFKSNGSFATTGIQTINLTATGKPIAAGTNGFSISFDGTVCMVQVEVLPNGSGGPATFTLQGAGGACTNAIINGVYVVSTPLNASNTVTLTANVTKIGTYSITTVAANGITFSGSGVFSSTGAKTIPLTGSGTPASNSSTSVSVTAGGGTCSFVVPISAPASLTIDCTSAIVSGTLSAGIAINASTTVSIGVTVISPGSYSISTASINGIVFSGSGTLAAGAQTITLTGSGTPTAAGNFTVAISFGGSSCSFPLTVSGVISTDWTFTQGATTTYKGVTDTAKLDAVASINVFSYSGSNATDNILLVLTDLAGGIQANEIYNTNAINNNSAGFVFVGATETYAADNTLGNVNLIFKVTLHNAATKTIQGTFTGTVLDTNSTIKNITNGQFKGTYK